MKVLWVLPKWPYPAIDGATKAHMALLQNWPKNISLDLIVYTDKTKTQDEIDTLKKVIGFENLILLPYTKTPRIVTILCSFFLSNPLPTTVKRFTNKKAIHQWENWISDKTWDCVVFDGLHPTALQLFTIQKKYADTIILRAHNVETELWEQAIHSAPFMLQWIYKIEKKRMQAFESSIYALCDLIVAVSQIDANIIRKYNPYVKIEVSPIGIDLSNTPPPMPQNETLELLFIGRLDWYPNVEGLQWFLEEIWPMLPSKNQRAIRLHIIGSFASSHLASKLNNIKNVMYHGKVMDLEPFYQKAVLTIIPILIGSGTRVKAIESAQFGRSFISTTKGIEGIALTPQSDFIEANTSHEWIESIASLSLENCATMGKNVRDAIKKNYDRQVIQEQFIGFLQQLTKP